MQNQYEYDKIKYTALFTRTAVAAIIVDVLVCISVLQMIFAPIYYNDFLGMTYSMWSNIRLFFEFISLVDFSQLGVFNLIEIISILLLIGAFIAALVNIILNIIFLAYKDVHVESKYKTLRNKSACKSTLSAVLLTVSIFFYFLLSNLLKAEDKTSITSSTEKLFFDQGLFYGNTYNMPTIKVLLITFGILILFVLVKKILGKRLDMHYAMDPHPEYSK